MSGLRLIRLLAPAALAASALVAPGSSADPAPGGFMSPNVTWVATIPLDAPGIGGRVLQVGQQRRFYVTGAKGLTIYDVTNPAVPVVAGAMALPHFENESVAVSDDGSTVVITSDPGFGQPPVTYVVDASIVAAPHVVSVIPEGSHTITCANPACTHVYASDGWTYDITDRMNPKPGEPWGLGAHYLSRDASGLISTGNVLLDPRKDPARPTVVKVGTGGWHNSLRPNADKWRPRKPGDKDPLLKPGELHIGGGETMTNQCSDRSAGVEVWGMANWDRGVRAKRLGEVKPKSGNYADGNPMLNAAGCSSHWFDYRAGVVAAGWYENGVRFLTVDERTGAMAEVGWFQPVTTEAWAAHWVDDEYVYTVDAVRGIDILKFRRGAVAPSKEALAASWRAPLFPTSAATDRERYLCRLAAPDGTRPS